MANPFRLPRTVTPSHYDLRLEPDLQSATFAGTVAVAVNVVTATSVITLNALDLDLAQESIEVDGSDGTTYSATDVEYDAESERAVLTFAGEIPTGDATLRVAFTGVLNDKLTGFYRSTYTDDDGVEQVLATTQFESTNARRAFPCWDEPDLKATFAVALVVDADLLAVSCQSETGSTTLDDGRREVHFAPTPIMSTYLLAFVVGRLEATEPVDVGGVPLRIVHRPGAGDAVGFALDAGAFALQWLTDYFGIPYPGDKLDMIAIPDFAFGAMENLGCVTYREILLIVDPATTTQPEQLRSVDVIAHELAHMWFGDLVTMRWWNGLWLKEAFATFMEMLVTDAYRPDWNRWVDFGVSRTAAFDVDSLSATRPIEFEVVSPDDAEGMYDLLTYEKGAAVVRMLEQYLGAEEFRRGATHYLNAHAFANTETHDLWDALEETSGQPVRRIMDSWIFQGGYPLVRVDRTSPTTVRLTQRQFRYRTDATADHRWSVPVVYTTGRGSDQTNGTALLEDESIEIEVRDDFDWIVINTAGSGFYRVDYDTELCDALLDNFDELTAVERYGVVDDTWALVVAGETAVADFLGVAQRCAADPDLAIWRRIAGSLGTLDHLATPADRPALAEWTRAFVAPRLADLGLERRPDEDDRTNELRALLLGTLGTVGDDTDTVATARTIVANPDADASLRTAAINVVAAHGTADEFASYTDAMAATDSPQEERRLMHALANFPGTAEIDKLLEMTLDGTLRTQDAAYVLGGALSNHDNGTRVWQFIMTNWDRITEHFPKNSIPRMLTGVRALSTEKDAASVHEFLATHEIPQGAKTVDQHLERLSINVELRARIASDLAAALG